MSYMRYLAIMLLASAILAGCGRKGEIHYDSGSIWGTTYHIKYVLGKDLSDSIIGVMGVVGKSLSPFDHNSMISAVNAGEDVVVDKMFVDVFDLSQRVCSLSGGVFDPTVAPLINLWGFGYREGMSDRPTKQQIDSALMTVGINECSIDAYGHVKRKDAATEFNFSAIAKGYGVDCIAAMLERNGCYDYMVEVGGEMALKGNGPTGDKWVIQIDAPVSETTEISHTQLQVLRITDCCIATSGNYRNHRDTSEGEVGHTISPVTGEPVMTNTLSATVIAGSTALADALATAIMAMPIEDALVMMEQIKGAEALIVLGRPDGNYDIVTTDRFGQAIIE